jgi:hypothetical protein
MKGLIGMVRRTAWHMHWPLSAAINAIALTLLLLLLLLLSLLLQIGATPAAT